MNKQACGVSILVSLALLCLTPLQPVIAKNLNCYGVTDLGTVAAIKINNRGQVFWNALVFNALHAFIWDRGVVTELGTLGGDQGSVAMGINDRGQVVGQSDTGETNIFGEHLWHAFLWEKGAMTDLGTLGGPTSYAIGLNSRGQVAGRSDLVDGTVHGFIWDHGIMTDLGTLDNSEVTGINERGQVAGFWQFSFHDVHPFIWENGLISDLGTLGGDNSAAYFINNRGQVVGEAQTREIDPKTGFPFIHAFLWENGSMTDLGTLGGDYSAAYFINSHGQVAGLANSPDGETHGFLWQKGAMHDLVPAAGLQTSGPTGLNDQGQVSGVSYDPVDYDPSLAIVWDHGVTIDLNRIIRTQSGFDLFEGYAAGINDRGQIIVVGIVNDEIHSFLLTPSGCDSPDSNKGPGLLTKHRRNPKLAAASLAEIALSYREQA